MAAEDGGGGREGGSIFGKGNGLPVVLCLLLVARRRTRWWGEVGRGVLLVLLVARRRTGRCGDVVNVTGTARVRVGLLISRWRALQSRDVIHTTPKRVVGFDIAEAPHYEMLCRGLMSEKGLL